MSQSAPPPHERIPDSTIALAREGYEFIGRRCRRHGTDVFETRIGLRPFICMRGADAARLFYDEERFQREGAAPLRVQRVLFGEGGLQTIDDAAHRHRKAMLMDLMQPDRVHELGAMLEQRWRERLRAWQRQQRVVLYDEMGELLLDTVCAWAGVPLDQSECARRAAEFRHRIEGAWPFSLRHVGGARARRRTESWLTEVVRQVRAGRFEPPADTALWVVAWHRDLRGHLLSPHTAAVELNNVVRPTVAVSLFIVFAALALHQQPEWRDRLRSADDASLQHFVQEVRRFYPFFPFVGARARKDFEWKGFRFPAGERALLDLYGTNHDDRLYQQPHMFWPERFERRQVDAFELIPQGGGDHFQQHRCAGEWPTIELMKRAVLTLTRWMAYDVPAQNLTVSLRDVPAVPKSRFVIENVRATEPGRP